MIKDILLHVCIIVFPLFIYQISWFDKYQQKDPHPKKLLISFCSSLSAILCMMFPITMHTGMQYDLRSIPMLMAVLYGGYGPGLAAGGAMLAFRFYLGGDGLYVTLISYTLYASLAMLFVSKWYSYPIGKKLWISFGLGIGKQLSSLIGVKVVTAWTGEQLEDTIVNLEAFSILTIVHIIATSLVVFLYEEMRRNFHMRQQVIRSEKVNLISELAASVAHEVRNPLTVVRGFVQLMGHLESDKRELYTKLIVTELDRAESIISDYLNFAKPQSEKQELLDVGEVISDVMAVMASFAALKGVELQVDAEANLKIRGNSAKVKQALMNLMKNGIESIENGGYVQIIACSSKGAVMIKISDNGQGMTPEQLQQLGQPFYSLKEKGTGLGLMVTFRIIESLGGKIEYKSKRFEGTEVVIVLPAASDLPQNAKSITS